MRTALRKMGNSAGVIVPKPLLAALGATVGSSFEASVEEGRLLLSPVRDHPRAGWAEAAKTIAGEIDHEAADWRDAPHEPDAELRW